VSVKTPRITPYGDSALIVQYITDRFSAHINDSVHHLAKALREQPMWQDLIPGYDSLLCVFDMAAISIEDAKRKIEDTVLNMSETPQKKGKIIDIPVVYGGDYGPDMDAIKKMSGLTQSEIIEMHSQQIYKVCMMGFIPGFCFLSEIPAILQHPRHTTPRAHVAAGSIGIAGWQTGIYGLDSPGGWQIIGRTPHKLFDKTREQPFLLEAGDSIQFIPSSKAIFS